MIRAVERATEEELDDPRVAEALEAYLVALAEGKAPDRDQYLAAHKDIAEPLAECLDGLRGLERLKRAVDSDQLPVPDFEGSTLGKYHIGKLLGRGGMGVVHEAFPLDGGEEVAIKILAGRPGESAIQRFRHEAEAATLLNHPNIVSVQEVGFDRGVHFFTMKRILGNSLADICDHATEGTVPRVRPDRTTRDTRLTNPSIAVGKLREPEFVVDLLLQAASALAHAHDAGIIHRDIKPGNLLLEPTGKLWIVDFGLARIPGAERMTRTGATLGTPRYMSPEQCDPKRGVVDHRTDLYSLGATAYELLSGRPLIEGDDRAVAARKLLEEEPVPLRSLAPGLPYDLETIVQKLLSKQPVDRYSTARELEADLRRYLAGTPIVAKRPTWWDRRLRTVAKHPRLVATSLLCLMLVAAAVTIQQHRLLRQREQTSQERDELRSALDDLFTRFAEERLDRAGEEPLVREFLTQALPRYERLAQASAASAHDKLAAAVARRRVATIEHRLGNLSAARSAFEQALQQMEALPDLEPGNRDRAIALNDYGNLLAEMGDRDEAKNSYRKASHLFQQLSENGAVYDRLAAAGSERNLGILALEAGNWAEAETWLKSARKQYARSEHPATIHEISACNRSLAELYLKTERASDAETVLREALTLLGTGTHDPRDRALCHISLAETLRFRGRVSEAHREALEAIFLWKQMGNLKRARDKVNFENARHVERRCRRAVRFDALVGGLMVSEDDS